MPMPSARPNIILKAVHIGFAGRGVWPAVHDPKEGRYQRLAFIFGYIAQTRLGYVLTDFGRRETMKREADWKQQALGRINVN
jgi:hypothetical protein